MQEIKPINGCQVVIQLNQDEVDALLSLLLCAPETEDVSEEMAAHLLRRIADAQRTLLRPAGVESRHEDSCV